MKENCPHCGRGSGYVEMTEKGYFCTNCAEFWKKTSSITSSNQWFSIETAPKDGTQILGYDPNHEEAKIYILRWESHCGYPACWFEASGEVYFTWSPTHWMPLPKPPEVNDAMA